MTRDSRPLRTGRPVKVALVSMPWYAPHRPSIQLGALKAWLNRTLPDVRVDPYHYHLAITGKIRYPFIREIGEGTRGFLFGEGLSACLLFPGYRTEILASLKQAAEKEGGNVDVEKDLLTPFERFVEEQAAAVEWSSYDCVGFSAGMVQTLGSVLMARIVKQRAPSVLTVLGGPEAAGPMGYSLLKVFPEIDCTVNGEGERPLAAIISALREGHELRGLPGVVTRDSREGAGCTRFQVDDLDSLPYPDYDGYFDLLSSVPCRDAVRTDVEIPVEGARGCWWANRKSDGHNTSCAFCNLNHQWRGYREKSAVRYVEEMLCLSERYRCRRFLFVENITRRKEKEVVALFTHIRDGFHRSPEIAMEARADMPPGVWKLLREAGVISCQIGIESLSTKVLRRIGKGTTALRNVEAMKELERWDIANPANLLHGLPGMSAEEVEENSRMIPFLKAYYPLAPVRFSLRHGSPYEDEICERGGTGGQRDSGNEPAWRAILPGEVESRLFFSSREFSNQTPGLAEAVARLEAVCREWLDHYTEAKRRGIRYLLSAVPDGTRPGGLIVRDFREQGFRIYRLESLEAEVYQFFDRRRKVRDCMAALPHIPRAMVEGCLRRFVERRLLLREGLYALSLAITLPGPKGDGALVQTGGVPRDVSSGSKLPGNTGRR